MKKWALTAAAPPGDAHVLAVEFEGVADAVAEHRAAVSQHQIGRQVVEGFVHVARVFGGRLDGADEVQLVRHGLRVLEGNLTLLTQI